MIKTFKEFRVFRVDRAPVVRLMSKGVSDRGESLSSMFSIIPPGGTFTFAIGGCEELWKAYSKLRWIQRLVTLLATMAAMSPYIVGHAIADRTYPLFLFLSVGGTLVLLFCLMNLTDKQFKDCCGNEVDFRLHMITLTDGTAIHLKGGEGTNGG